MARPTSTQAPVRTPIVDRSGFLDQAWIEFFLRLQLLIDGRSYRSESDAFSLGTSGYASGEWAAIPGTPASGTAQKVRLPAGTWRLSGAVEASWTSSAPTWTHLKAKWATANGANSSSEPASPSVAAGVSRMAVPLSNAGGMVFPMPLARVSLLEDTDIFLVPAVTFSGAGDAFLKTHIYAEFIAKSVGGVS